MNVTSSLSYQISLLYSAFLDAITCGSDEIICDEEAISCDAEAITCDEEAMHGDAFSSGVSGCQLPARH